VAGGRIVAEGAPVDVVTAELVEKAFPGSIVWWFPIRSPERR
jgi:hypothetical protein